jgi:hypothetical protein
MMIANYRNTFNGTKKIGQDIYRKIQAARAFGYTNEELTAALSEVGFRKDESRRIARGIMSKPQLSDDSLKDMRKLKETEEFSNEPREIWYRDTERTYPDTFPLTK